MDEEDDGMEIEVFNGQMIPTDDPENPDKKFRTIIIGAGNK